MWNIEEFLSGLNIDLDRLRDVFTYDPQAPMIFSSGIFLWLFVAFILVYLLLQRRTTALLLLIVQLVALNRNLKLFGVRLINITYRVSHTLIKWTVRVPTSLRLFVR